MTSQVFAVLLILSTASLSAMQYEHGAVQEKHRMLYSSGMQDPLELFAEEIFKAEHSPSKSVVVIPQLQEGREMSTISRRPVCGPGQMVNLNDKSLYSCKQDKEREITCGDMLFDYGKLFLAGKILTAIIDKKLN